MALKLKNSSSFNEDARLFEKLENEINYFRVDYTIMKYIHSLFSIISLGWFTQRSTKKLENLAEKFHYLSEKQHYLTEEQQEKLSRITTTFMECIDQVKSLKWQDKTVILNSQKTTVKNSLTSITEMIFEHSITKPTKESMIFKGSQENCSGLIDIQTAKNLQQKLLKKSPPGITFNEINSTDIYGGTCSAMSLEFANQYFKIKQNPLLRSLRSNILSLENLFALSSIDFRTKQAAYNAIQVTQPKADLDHSRNKVQALANAYDFKIDYTSEEIDFSSDRAEKDFKKKIDQLPNGAYLVRMVSPADNEKLEHFGHSLIYIKEKGIQLGYDPCKGLMELGTAAPIKVEFQALNECYNTWGLNKTRFYRLQLRNG